jgi:hypothetical protein
VNVRYALLVKRLHEQAAQSVKIVVLADMVMGVRCAKQGSIVNLLWTIPRSVSHVELDYINQTLDKPAAFRARQENISIAKEKRYV